MTAPSARPPWRSRLRYAFDETMAAGPIALVAWLGAITLLVVALTAVVLASTGNSDGGFFESAWQSLMHALDASMLSGAERPVLRVMMLPVAITGLFIVAALIGLVSSSLDQRIEELRKGRSQVLETGHTLIIGWSPKVFSILSELATANRNVRRSRVVVLADVDKVEMQDAIRARAPDLGDLRVICRTGDPLVPEDVRIANPAGAKSIVLLAEPESGDSEIIKCLLALLNDPERGDARYHVVVELRDARNVALVNTLGVADDIHIVVSHELIARIMAQTCRQSGLSVVHEELLGFSGEEMYFQRVEPLVGRTYRDAALSLESSAILGLRRGGGEIVLNPPADTVLADNDELLLIAQDDEPAELAPDWPREPGTAAVSTRAARDLPPERTLILGWNPIGLSVVRELDQYVTAGSDLTIVADGLDLEAIEREIARRVTNHRLVVRRGDTTDRETLEELEPQSYDHIIILAYRQTMTPREADAHTLVTLLYLRSIAANLDRSFSIVTEMLDNRSRHIAQVTTSDDFIVDAQLVSYMLAQLAETPALDPVSTDLFSASGNEVYLKHADEYVRLGEPVDFYVVVATALDSAETAIGYRRAAHAVDPERQFGVVLNPRKSEPIVFEPGDRVIVVARD